MPGMTDRHDDDTLSVEHANRKHDLDRPTMHQTQSALHASAAHADACVNLFVPILSGARVKKTVGRIAFSKTGTSKQSFAYEATTFGQLP